MSTVKTDIADSSDHHADTGKAKRIGVGLLLILFVGLASMSLVTAQRTERQRAQVGLAGGKCTFEQRVPNWLRTVAGDEFHSFLDYPVIVAVAMAGEKITDANLAKLPEMPELRSLDLDNAQVTSEGMKLVSQWKNIHRINLTNTQVTDITPLAELPHLESLKLNFSPVRKEHLTGLSQLKSLTDLGAGYIRVTDEDVIEIVKCPQLVDLSIAASDLGEHGLQPLTALQELKTLVLVKAKYDSADLEAFKAARPDVGIGL
ncbi:MAG: hypothetical protein ABGZ17_01820 [Planctomycetaceae bacterium]|jgi:hypothetical protein